MNAQVYRLLLLPHYFIKVGILFLIGWISFLVIAFLNSWAISDKVATSGILLSLLIFVVTKRKQEDELTMAIRVQAYAFSFLYCVIGSILDPFFKYFFNSDLLDTQGVMFQALFIYFFWYWANISFVLKD